MRDFYETSIEAVRLVRPLMPIIIHDSFRGPMWATLLKDFPYKNIVMVRGLGVRERSGLGPVEVARGLRHPRFVGRVWRRCWYGCCHGIRGRYSVRGDVIS